MTFIYQNYLLFKFRIILKCEINRSINFHQRCEICITRFQLNVQFLLLFFLLISWQRQIIGNDLKRGKRV